MQTIVYDHLLSFKDKRQQKLRTLELECEQLLKEGLNKFGTKLVRNIAQSSDHQIDEMLASDRLYGSRQDRKTLYRDYKEQIDKVLAETITKIKPLIPKIKQIWEQYIQEADGIVIPLQLNMIKQSANLSDEDLISTLVDESWYTGRSDTPNQQRDWFLTYNQYKSMIHPY